MTDQLQSDVLVCVPILAEGVKRPTDIPGKRK